MKNSVIITIILVVLAAIIAFSLLFNSMMVTPHYGTPAARPFKGD